MRTALLALAALSLDVTAALATPSRTETWKPASTTASITGAITLSPALLAMKRARFPLAVAADTPAFKADTGTYRARILRVTRPSNPPLGQKNRLCTAPVRWIVVWHENDDPKAHLGMAVFSGDAQPTGEDSPGLCGTFYYAR